MRARYGEIASAYDREAAHLAALAAESRRWATTTDDPADRFRSEQLAALRDRRAAECRAHAREAWNRQRTGTDGPLCVRDGEDIGNNGEPRLPGAALGSGPAEGACVARRRGRGGAAESAFAVSTDPFPGLYYRVTSRGGDGAGAWCFRADQLARFTTGGRFDCAKWRAWAAVRSQWQPEAHELHVLHVDRGRPFVAHTALAALGLPQQTYIERARVLCTETWALDSPRLQEYVRELSLRHPVGGLVVGVNRSGRDHRRRG